MSILSVTDLKVRYSASGPEILKGISFDVEPEGFKGLRGGVHFRSFLILLFARTGRVMRSA